jgi:hypothetical protein
MYVCMYVCVCMGVWTVGWLWVYVGIRRWVQAKGTYNSGPNSWVKTRCSGPSDCDGLTDWRTARGDCLAEASGCCPSRHSRIGGYQERSVHGVVCPIWVCNQMRLLGSCRCWAKYIRPCLLALFSAQQHPIPRPLPFLLLRLPFRTCWCCRLSLALSLSLSLSHTFLFFMCLAPRSSSSVSL